MCNGAGAADDPSAGLHSMLCASSDARRTRGGAGSGCSAAKDAGTAEEDAIGWLICFGRSNSCRLRRSRRERLIFFSTPNGLDVFKHLLLITLASEPQRLATGHGGIEHFAGALKSLDRLSQTFH